MSGEEPKKLLLIGLDAADRQLVERWADEGHLPNIAGLRETGVWGSLDTTADTVHVSAWPGIYSGVTPDRHGLYHAYIMREGEQSPCRPRPEDCPVPFFWEILNDHGKQSIIIDAFLTCPLRDFKGIQITDWGSWTWFHGQDFQPAWVKDEIRKRFGPYPAEDHSQVGMTPPTDPVGFRDRLIKAVDTKARAAEWLLESQPWDCFLVVFGECHAGGHYFWHYHDEDYVAHPEACEESLRTALRDIYAGLDSAIGKLIEAAGPDVTVMVVSGDGMGPNYSASHLLPDMLKEMKLAGPGQEAGKDDDAAPAKQSFASRLRNLVPKSFRSAVSRHLLPRSINEKLSLHWKTADIDWASTRAFVIDNANEGFVRVNLEGREPEGVVSGQEAYDTICGSLADVAERMINPSNGRRVVDSTVITSQFYSGPCVVNMPDVIFRWDPGAKVTTKVVIEGLGEIEVPHAAYEVSPYYTGNHRGDAFVAVQGPGIEHADLVHGGSILDLAPTILDFFGVPAPEDVDGRVRSEILWQTMT